MNGPVKRPGARQTRAVSRQTGLSQVGLQQAGLGQANSELLGLRTEESRQADKVKPSANSGGGSGSRHLTKPRRLLRWPAALTAALLVLLLLGSAAAAAANLDIPEPTGDIYVQDFEGLLAADQKAELSRLGRALEGATKAQVAVLTVPDFGGADIEQYGNQAFRKYALGNKELNNGVMLLLSMGERQARIEVGYGLEGAIPDGKAGRILDSTTIPYLKENKPDQAIIQTYKALYNEVASEYGVQDKLNPEAVVQPESGAAAGQDGEGGFSILWMIGIAVLIALDFIFFRGAITLTLLSMLGRGGGGWGRGGGDGGGFRGGGGGSSGGGGASRRF
ncbi:YgcG family protein [Paenibacillus sp. J22TS3]|uniref:TPM domain-containing protein n=1 Tax=Paenibacillus sp. J22TS3 TaxID=2807192 RepID=UPI001B08F4A4|nr:TPM domain-containing protein [Paenibacillus sp. J22TS3]GIP24212.1 hypothetical protein J22TS3_44870 [Paenibacillus sp. J22TS3]